MKKLLFMAIFLNISNSLWALEYLDTKPMLIYGDFRSYDRVINKTVSEDQNKIELDNYSSQKIEVTSTKKIFLSAGAISTASQALTDNLYGWGTLGIFPQANSYAKYYKEFSDIQSYENHHFEIPKSSNDLASWQSGDAVFYNAIGGLKLLLLAGYAQIGAGIQAIVEGGFSVYLEKKENNQVYIELQRNFTKGIGALAGTYIAYAELVSLVEKNKGHIFLLNLNNEDQKNALNDFLERGILSNLQRLAKNSEELNNIGDVSSIKKSKTKKMALATPIIPFLETSRSSISEDISITRNNDFGFREDLNILEQSLNRNNRFFKYQKEFSRSVIVEKNNLDDKVAVKLNWNSNTNRSNEKRLSRVLRRFVKDTKQEWVNNLNDSETNDEKLKYLEVDLNLQFSQEAIAKMLAKDDLAVIAKKMAKFWKKNNFEDAINLMKKCGGTLQAVIQGQRISRIMRSTTFSYDSTACEL